MRAARTPARELLADFGALAPQSAPGKATAWLAPTSRLALRNAVRRPVRTVLTVGALGLGGALLLTAGNVYVSLQGALASAVAARGEDIAVRLLKPAPALEVADAVATLPGVRSVETWGATRVALALPGGVGTSRYTLFAPPADTTLMQPRVVAGRWPAAEELAVAINRTLQSAEDGLEVGGEATLLLEKRRVAVPIVGVIEEVAEPALYTGAGGFEAITGLVGTAGDLRVVTADGEAQAVAVALEEALLARGWFPLDVMTHDTYGEALSDHFIIVLLCLTVIAGAAIVVGGLGLATSMSLGVLERTREIGVLRTLGATRRIVLRVVLIEGLMLAAGSTLLAVALAIPLSIAVCGAVGSFGLHAEVALIWSPAAFAAWLVLVSGVTTLACVGPARAALRLAVRDTLTYE